MASPVEQATAFKNDGNKAFAAHDWPKAIELYTKAIELNEKEATFYTNRAQVRVPHVTCFAALKCLLRHLTSWVGCPADPCAQF